MHEQHPGTVWDGEAWITYAEAVATCPPEEWQGLLDSLNEAVDRGEFCAVAPRNKLLGKIVKRQFNLA